MSNKKTKNCFMKLVFMLAIPIIAVSLNKTDIKAAAPGYHSVVTGTTICHHDANVYGGAVYCSGTSLNPNQAYIWNNMHVVAPAGTQLHYNGLHFTTRDKTGTHASGISNIVAWANVEGADYEIAGCYVDAGSGWEGYAYYTRYFSWCPNESAWYGAGTSHYWLGVQGYPGTPEFHLVGFDHPIASYSDVPNTYYVNFG